jgi:hypothetical protein
MQSAVARAKLSPWLLKDTRFLCCIAPIVVRVEKLPQLRRRHARVAGGRD